MTNPFIYLSTMAFMAHHDGKLVVKLNFRTRGEFRHPGAGNIRRMVPNLITFNLIWIFSFLPFLSLTLSSRTSPKLCRKLIPTFLCNFPHVRFFGEKSSSPSQWKFRHQMKNFSFWERSEEINKVFFFLFFSSSYHAALVDYTLCFISFSKTSFSISSRKPCQKKKKENFNFIFIIIFFSFSNQSSPSSLLLCCSLSVWKKI